MIEDLGDLLVEDGEEMFEALSQMPVISISSLDSDLKKYFSRIQIPVLLPSGEKAFLAIVFWQRSPPGENIFYE